MKVAPAKPLRIVVPGGSGQVGRLLARHFYDVGHSVTTIARKPLPAEWPTLAWDGCSLGPWTAALEGADVVINLAGRSVNCRYNEHNRREIRESRLRTTELVGKAIAQLVVPPKLWMNASTATIYRHSLDREMDETHGEIGGKELNAPSTWGFSIDVATSWEKAFFEAESPATRKIALRSAMTMSPDCGGVFDVLLKLVRSGFGGTAGPGTQFVSWIHEFDFIRAVEFLIKHDEFTGPVNVCSPNPLPNREFMRSLRKASCVPIGLPSANWMLELGALFLGTETELVLKSRRVVPGRLLNAGFTFHFPNWCGAATELVERRHESDGKPFGC